MYLQEAKKALDRWPVPYEKSDYWRSQVDSKSTCSDISEAQINEAKKKACNDSTLVTHINEIRARSNKPPITKKYVIENIYFVNCKVINNRSLLTFAIRNEGGIRTTVWVN